MEIMYLIMARRGSKGIRGKNRRSVGGADLVGHALDHATRAGADPYNILILTDDPVISCRYNGFVIDRPERVSRDDTSSIETIKWFLGEASLSGRDAVVLLQPTSPLRSPDDIRACVEAYKMGDNNYVCSSTETGPPKPNGAVYVYGVDALVKDDLGEPLYITMPERRSIDIDTMEDLERARAIYNSY